MRSYEAARSLFSFLGFMAWSVIIIGVIVAVIGMGGASRYGGGSAALIAMIPGISIGISGFILLAFVQMGRASVDTAEYTQQMLKIARDQLEVSRQALKGAGHQPKRYEAIKTQNNTKGGFENANFGFDANGNGEEKPQPVSKPTPAMIEGEKLEYLGQTITRKNGMYVTSGSSYDSLLFAKTYIENKQKQKI